MPAGMIGAMFTTGAAAGICFGVKAGTGMPLGKNCRGAAGAWGGTWKEASLRTGAEVHAGLR